MPTAIDLFAGIGGNTIAAKQSGIHVLWAANHNKLVVDFHSQNHPDVEHSCQDLQQADWSQVPYSDLLMASPCCQGHTKARGKEGPHHHLSRSTAWAPVACAEYHSNEFIMIENVTEFLEWSLLPQWQSCFETLGYSLSINILDSADYGIAQHRKRVFIIGTKSKNPIKLKLVTEEHRPFSSIVKWDSAKWSPISKPGRAQATLLRIESGRSRFGDCFVMPYYKSGSGKTGRSLDRPLGTVTTKDRWAIVKGNNMRMLSVEEYRRAMSFPENTILPRRKDQAVHALGNATCPKLVRKVLAALLKAA